MATRTITVGTAGVPLDREVGGTDLSTDRTAAEMRTALALGTAAVADDGDFASATRTVGTGLGTSGTVNLDMASVHGTIQTIAASGTITFTTSNRAAGREVTLIIAAGGSSRTLAWPSWIAVGAALPTALASGKTLVATVTFVDTTDAAAVAAAAVQPVRTLTLTDPALIAPKVPTYGAVVAALSPIAYWPMQETSGTTMTAVTGTNGTYNGPVLTAGVGPVASLPNAPIFDGVNDYASAALNLSAYSTVSVAFWLWWDSYGTGDDLALEHTANANNANAFQIDPDDPYSVFVIGQTGTSGGYRQGQITRPSAAAWHHYRFVLRRDGNLPKCTVDGVVQTVGNRFSQGTVSGTFTNSTLYVMSRAGASLFGDGRMVGLAVFPGEVSDADAARLAAAT